MLAATIGGLAAPAGPAVASSRSAAARSVSASTSAWITATGRDLTGRSPSPRVRASWITRLQNGMARSVLTDRVSRSDFADDLVIRDVYARILGRPPTADWAATWFVRLRDGTQANDLVVDLYGSDELYRQVGGTSSAITDHLYLQILGHLPTAARRGDVIRELDAGMSRTDLADHLWRSAERARGDASTPCSLPCSAGPRRARAGPPGRSGSAWPMTGCWPPPSPRAPSTTPVHQPAPPPCSSPTSR